MAQNSLAKLVKLIKQYQYILWMGAVAFVLCLGSSLWIYYYLEGDAKETYWFEVAEFLSTAAETILTTVLIGGGLGGIVNFIFEEQKKEEEEVKERLKRMQESRDRRKAFRSDLRHRLQSVHDQVELARVLIKSHRSGNTYGEQIREHIMPANITIQDIKNRLSAIEDESPIPHLPELQVSLTYMSAYLSVLIEEFSQHYLDIAMVQNYQDSVASRRRDVFTDIISEPQVPDADDARLLFLEKADQRMDKLDLPERLIAVWEAMGRLDYVWDFLADRRDTKGKASRYQQFFIDHHYHCFRLLRDKDNDRNERLCRRAGFDHYLAELERLKEKKKTDQPITKEDSLTRIIMQDGLGFEFDKKRSTN
ncbi:MAG: hypothetical protein AAFN81_01170 [Bacteroidota bacterium]